jgi:hypothetical protein
VRDCDLNPQILDYRHSANDQRNRNHGEAHPEPDEVLHFLAPRQLYRRYDVLRRT